MIVCNTSPIINLACIGKLDILRVLYREIAIPPAVYHEIAIAAPNAPGALEIRNADWIQQVLPTDTILVETLRLELDPGEAEAIACALDNKAQTLLIDERKGRFIAKNLGISVIGLLGILLLAKQRGHIPATRPLMNELRIKAGFWISDALYEHVLLESGEAL